MSEKLKIIALKNLISQGRVECVKTYRKNGGKVIAYDFRIDKEFVIFCECDSFIDKLSSLFELYICRYGRT